MTTAAPTFDARSAEAIKRRSGTGTATIHRTLASAQEIDTREIAAMAIKPPASVTAVAFWGCDTSGGTFTAIHDSDGTATSITVTALDWYDCPAACFAFPYIKIVSTGADGTATFVFKT